MKLPILSDQDSPCTRCVALCCRYFAFEIDKPSTRRDFDDLRWYLLHEDTIIFVEDGEWYIQINRRCRELGPDNRCGVYERRPAICRSYKTTDCDWHCEEYDYQELFTEPQQMERYARAYLSRRRKQRRSARRRPPVQSARTGARRRVVAPRRAGKAALPLRWRKTA